jgi:hypothetical protein
MKNKPLGPGQIRIRPVDRSAGLKSASPLLPTGAGRSAPNFATTGESHSLRWLAAVLIVTALAFALWQWQASPSVSPESSSSAGLRSAAQPQEPSVPSGAITQQTPGIYAPTPEELFEPGGRARQVTCRPNLNAISQWHASAKRCYVSIPPRPAPPGKYIAFREARSSTAAQSPDGGSQADAKLSTEDALIFQAAAVTVVVVASEYEIPALDRINAATWSPKLGVTPRRRPPFTVSIDDKGHVSMVPGDSPPPPKASTSTYIFPGDADIDFGPVVGPDTQQFDATLQEGNLITLNSKYSRHAPRGPPSGEAAIVYIVGSVRDVHGPDQKDYSSLKSQIVDLARGHAKTTQFDLRPTPQEQSEWARQVEQWRAQVRPTADEYHVSLDAIGERSAELGRLDVPDPPTLGQIDRGFPRGSSRDMLDRLKIGEKPGEKRIEPHVEPHLVP